MKTAFKEWAVVCRALARGQQTVILRKGGIVEEGGRFRPDHSEFLLFPTYSHQSPENVIPAVRAWLSEVENEQPEAGTVTFSHYASVANALRVQSLETVLGLEGEHIWSKETIVERFHRWGDEIHVLVVRVYSLANPVTMALRDEYAGCKSWVELAEDVSTDGATPVLSDADFALRQAWVQTQLKMA